MSRRAGAGCIVALATTLPRETLLDEGRPDRIIGTYTDITDDDLTQILS